MNRYAVELGWLACLAALLLATGSRAEVYKWVDGSGQTHYSASKAEAGKAGTETLKAPADAPPTPPAGSGSQYPRKVDSLMGEPPPKRKAPTPRPSASSRPKSLSGGRDNGTDESRCALARDVLSGAVRHTNGKPTDDYDRQVAENDVRTFCH